MMHFSEWDSNPRLDSEIPPTLPTELSEIVATVIHVCGKAHEVSTQRSRFVNGHDERALCSAIP